MSPIQRNTKPKDKIFHYTYADRDISISPLRIFLKETFHVSSSIAESNLITQCEMMTFFTACHKLELSACTVSQDRCSTFLSANGLSGTTFFLYTLCIQFKQKSSQTYIASDAVMDPENEILI